MKNILYPAFVFCFFSAALCSAREVFPLDGEWEFSFDGGKKEKVSVPHTWNALDAAAGPKSGRHSALSVQSKSYKRGKGVYSREIPVKKKSGKRYFVRGEGASIVSEVFVNGKSAGTHEGAFGAFCYEITDLLGGGRNTLTVSADNSYNDNIVPLSGDFSMFGGLYRSISLIETDALCIDPAFFASPGVLIRQSNVSKSSAEISVETLLSGKAGTPAKISIAVKDAAGRTVASKKMSAKVPEKAGEGVPATLKILSPKLWQSRKNPYLYTVEVEVSDEAGTQTDTVIQPLGLRDFEIMPDRGFVLNGSEGTLRGVCRHQDFEGKGWAISKDDEANDIEMILEMGADALRTAHYPQTEHIYDLCDRAGIVVWSEVPAIEKVRDRPEFVKNLKLQAREMVLQHGNHPSICMWGIFNEIFHQTSAEDRKANMIGVLTDLNKYMHELDSTRPTVSATNQSGNKRLNSISDHLAANVYPGWYGGNADAMGGMIDGYRKNNSGRGFGISEYGHGGDIATHEYPVKKPVPTGSHHPEEYQAVGHEGNYRKIKERPQVWGTFIWNMFDFATAERKEGAKAGMNDKGLVTYDRKTRKDAFYFYKANWNPEPMAHLTSKRFKKRPAGTVEVKAYTNADSLELRVNNKRIGKAKADEINVVRWSNVELKPGKNAIKIRGKVGTKTVTDECVWICE